MARWPKSGRAQAAVAFVVGLLAAICVLVRIETTSFNNYYFGPHKAYPYPYADAHTYRIALYRDCGLTMLGVFAVVFVIQRLFTALHRS